MLSLCILAALTTVTPADVLLHDFEDISVWQPNQDGGHAAQLAADPDFAREGQGLRVRYVDEPPHWGNSTGPCSVPADAVALRFWVYKHSASAEAVLHIWLFEPDNDGWIQRVPFPRDSLAQVAVGWHEVRMPVSAFRFEPRGRKTQQMTTVDRMLIGCNYGSLEVTIDSMVWETGQGGAELPLPRTDNLRIETGERGSIGILDMGEGLPDGFTTAHPPQRLAEVLRGGGFGATILQAGDLADPGVLTPDRLDATILPFGPYFPQGAKGAFLDYLRAGGSFLSTDGYAFDQLVVLTEGGWSVLGPERTAAEMDQAPDPGPVLSMNTRVGKSGDAVTLQPAQIGVFDPHFPLEYGTRFAAGAWLGSTQGPAGPTYEFDRPVAGFSACGLIGQNSPVFPPVYRRWVPVLEVFDKDGGLRGTALSIMHNYAGEFPRSSWAFSGLTDGTDLFLDGPRRQELLLRVLDEITRKVFLHTPKTDLACYEPGETATISVAVANNGPQATRGVVVLRVGDREVGTERVELAPGASTTVQAQVAIDGLKTDYCPVTAVLRAEGGGPLDQVETAFCIRDQAVLASGPKIGWAGNYMTVDGRPTFLIGSNQTGMMYYSDHETPAIWDRDFRTMGEHGFHILRILHFSPFAKGGYEGGARNGPLDLAERPERLVRQMDAIVQLAQKHRVAIFLSLHDWMGTVLTDEELAAQADWNRFWAGRYRDVPGIFYDVQNEPSVAAEDRPDIVALWNEFLLERYDSDEALRAAWAKSPPEAALPNVPFGPTSNDWDDTRSADRKRFETELLNRWVKANVEGIRAGDPEALICVGYLPSMPPADKILGVRHTDFSNMHYYGSVDGFPLEFKLIDRRFQGKGFSLGEFGAQEAHNARAAGSFDLNAAESVHRFQAYAHYAFGLGATFMANWDWKEFDEMIFPWGLMQRGSYVAKPWLHTLEQEYLLLSFFAPAYESPEAFILAPDSHRIGPRFNEVHNALKRSIDLLLDRRVNFGMANEEEIGDLPASAKALVWPVPYCPDDETFAAVVVWVRGGGTLYLSGDVSFDRTRQRTRSERLAELKLASGPGAPPFETPDEAWGQAPVEAAVGQGKVLYVPYPLELRGQDTDAAIYERFLTMAGVARVEVECAEPSVRALSIPTTDGGRVTMLARRGGEGLVEASVGSATVELAPDGFAFVALGPDGTALAAESQGRIMVGDELIAEAEGHFAVCSLDGRGVGEARELVVLPHQCERVRVPRREPLQGAQCTIGPASGPGEVRPFEASISFGPGHMAVITPPDAAARAAQRVQSHLRLLADRGER